MADIDITGELIDTQKPWSDGKSEPQPSVSLLISVLADMARVARRRAEAAQNQDEPGDDPQQPGNERRGPGLDDAIVLFDTVAKLAHSVQASQKQTASATTDSLSKSQTAQLRDARLSALAKRTTPAGWPPSTSRLTPIPGLSLGRPRAEGPCPPALRVSTSYPCGPTGPSVTISQGPSVAGGTLSFSSRRASGQDAAPAQSPPTRSVTSSYAHVGTSKGHARGCCGGAVVAPPRHGHRRRLLHPPLE